MRILDSLLISWVVELSIRYNKYFSDSSLWVSSLVFSEILMNIVWINFPFHELKIKNIVRNILYKSLKTFLHRCFRFKLYSQVYHVFYKKFKDSNDFQSHNHNTQVLYEKGSCDLHANSNQNIIYKEKYQHHSYNPCSSSLKINKCVHL